MAAAVAVAVEIDAMLNCQTRANEFVKQCFELTGAGWAHKGNLTPTTALSATRNMLPSPWVSSVCGGFRVGVDNVLEEGLEALHT